MKLLFCGMITFFSLSVLAIAPPATLLNRADKLQMEPRAEDLSEGNPNVLGCSGGFCPTNADDSRMRKNLFEKQAEDLSHKQEPANKDNVKDGTG